MRRYKIPHFLWVGALIVLPTFLLGVAPALQDLQSRLENLEADAALITGRVEALEAQSEVLEGQVAGLEAGAELLEQQLALLQAESNREPVLIDANGVRVGNSVDFGDGDDAFVLFHLDGFPLFRLRFDTRGTGSQRSLWFESINCSGQPYIQREDSALPPLMVFHRAVLNPVHVADNTVPQRLITTGSELDVNGTCRGRSISTTVFPALPVFVWQDQFTPPFKVVTRGEFLAMQ